MKIRRDSVLTLVLLITLMLILSTALSGCGADGKDSADSSMSSGDTANPSDSTSDEADSSDPEVNPFEGYKAPDFELEDLGDNKVKLSGLRGKTVVINFWSLGCSYCLAEMPEFDSFNSSKPDDVEVLMVNLDQDQNRLSTYIKDKGYKFTVLKDEDAETLKSYLIRGVPTTVVVGQDGIVVSRIEGPLTKKDLEELVKASGRLAEDL